MEHTCSSWTTWEPVLHTATKGPVMATCSIKHPVDHFSSQLLNDAPSKAQKEQDRAKQLQAIGICLVLLQRSASQARHSSDIARLSIHQALGSGDADARVRTGGTL